MIRIIVDVAFPVDFADEIENSPLPSEADQSAQALFDDRPLSFEPGQPESLLEELVVDLDIGPYRRLMVYHSTVWYT